MSTAMHPRGSGQSVVMKRVAQVLALVLVQAGALFTAAGRLDWVAGWVYLGLYLAFIGWNAWALPRRNPGVIEERAAGRSGPGVKAWDVGLGRLFVPLFLAMLVVPGLDVRFGWSAPFAISVRAAGGVVFALGYALFGWAMVSNPFFSQVVRIQRERGHVAVSAGPYGYVRHPGYVGQLWASLAVPLLLGSLWGLVPAGLSAALIVLRTALEDRTLRTELEGYAAYAGRVRFRLFPGLW